MKLAARREAEAAASRPLQAVQVLPTMPATGTLPDLSSGRAVRYAPTYAENEALLSWLRTEAPEDVLEPELPIVDCHHHFWDLRGKLYDDYDYGPRGQVVYGLDECLEDMCDGHRVTHTGESAAGRPANSCSSAAPTAHASINQSVSEESRLNSIVACAVFLQASAGGQYPNWHNSSAPEHLRPTVEVELCQGIAAKCDAEKPGAPKICAGIMGYADFQDPLVEELLLADCRVRNFRGVRGPSPVRRSRSIETDLISIPCTAACLSHT